MDCAYYEVIVPAIKLRELECTLDGKKMAASGGKCSRKQGISFSLAESTAGCVMCVKNKKMRRRVEKSTGPREESSASYLCQQVKRFKAVSLAWVSLNTKAADGA